MFNQTQKKPGNNLGSYDVDSNLVRYAELLPGKNAFIDARTPGSHLKENYCIIGDGVAENPAQPVHILDKKGFNVGATGQPSGITNSLHSHTTAEIFVIFRGQFRLFWGNQGQHEEILKAGDMISLPNNCFRGFEVIGDEYGFLFAFLGGDDSGGGVTWHPDVIKKSASYGLILLEDRTLVDTVAGHRLPDGVAVMPPMTEQKLAEFDDYSPAEMLANVIFKKDLQASDKPFADGSFKQFNLSGGANNHYDFQLKRDDGLCVFAYEMKKKGCVPLHRRDEPEALVNFDGDTLLTLVDGECVREVLMTRGDTFSLPKGIPYMLQCKRGRSLVYSVVNGNNPEQAVLVEDR